MRPYQSEYYTNVAGIDITYYLLLITYYLLIMSYCINSKCQKRQNSDEVKSCQTCGTTLFIHNRYRIVRPLREPNPNHPTEVFEVEDWEDWGMLKVLKVLKHTNNPDLVKRFQQEAHILRILNKLKKYNQRNRVSREGNNQRNRVSREDHNKILTFFRKKPGFSMSPYNQELVVPSIDAGYFTIDLGQDNKLYGLVMEKIEGDNLEKLVVEQGPISQGEALVWLRQIVETLHLLHAHNFLHRDIKPANLIRQPNGKIALIDFGVAGIEGLAETQIGSLGYAAPEQMEITGKAVPQSDFFALGRTFVYLLTGRHPWELAMDNKKGRLMWYKSIRQTVDNSLVHFIDQLMHLDYHKRPQDTSKILKRLAKLTKQQSQLEKSLRLLSYFVGILFFVACLPFLNKHVLQRLLDINFAAEGSMSYNQGNLGKSKVYSRVALTLNRHNALSYHTLGLMCDDEKNFQCAANRYRQAIQAVEHTLKDNNQNNDNIIVFIDALNNLSRLKLLHVEPNFPEAATHLAKARGLIPQARNHPEYGEYWNSIIPEVEADLEKNRGWLALEEGRYEKAQKSLEQAIAIRSRLDNPKPDAYCWLAKVLKETDASKPEISKAGVKCKELPNEHQKPEIEQLRQEIDRYLNPKGEINEN
ncbi:MAG: protein kinase [Symploca sp. SIO2E6]|nr:protein kinase [Symploca sp. SIO2E6]